MTNYFNPRHDFNVSWTISDLYNSFSMSAKAKQSSLRKSLMTQLLPWWRKLLRYRMLFTVTVKNSKIPIDPNEELKLKCIQRISVKQDAVFELEILCVNWNPIKFRSWLPLFIQKNDSMLKVIHGLCEIESQREWS